MCAIDYSESNGVGMTPTVHKAVKAHTCSECGREIAKGERYEKFTWIDFEMADMPGRAWTSVKVCAHCIAVRRWLKVVCSGWVYAGVYEDLKEHWDEFEVPRTVAFGRLLLCMRGKWRHPRADRMVTVDEITSWVDQALLVVAKPLAA